MNNSHAARRSSHLPYSTPAGVAATDGRQGLRAEIQGLRAVAVGVVVLYHLGLPGFTGGYVGVDVFFVISGFLITSHLARRIERTGRVGLADFWARRARRLLPASLLVLGVSLVLMRLVIPSTLWEQTLRQVVASTFYVQNWALARDTVDYSAAGNTPTIVQHYWSLSVEEQFYVLWPLLLLLVLTVARRLRPALTSRAVLVGTITAVTALSFAWSLVATGQDASRAYFDTFTRMWEFGVGALLALVVSRRLPRVLGWVGLAAIVVATFTYDHATAFPGYTAVLPVLGAALVIGAGGSTSRWAADRPLSTRPAVFVGDVSYAIYLWHWPLIVAWPEVTGRALTVSDRVVIVALTLGLAWASTRWFEDPLRSGPFLSRSNGQTLVASLATMGLITVAALGLGWQQRHDAAVARDLAETRAAACLGPAALDPGADCELGDSLESLLAEPATVALENTEPVFPGCQADLDATEESSCTLGRTEGARGTIAVVGDSHATHWFSALDAWGRANDWRVVTHTRSSCPFTTARRTLPDEPDGRYERCAEGNRRVLESLEADPDVSVVVTSTYSSAYGWTDQSGRRGLDALAPGVEEVADRLASSGKELVVIRDVPLVKDRKNATDCLARTGSVEDCSLPRDDAVVPDAYADAARRLDLPVVDLTDRLCTDTTCPSVIGDVIVFRDYSHLSADYSRLLGPILGERLAPALGRASAGSA